MYPVIEQHGARRGSCVDLDGDAFVLGFTSIEIYGLINALAQIEHLLVGRPDVVPGFDRTWNIIHQLQQRFAAVPDHVNETAAALIKRLLLQQGSEADDRIGRSADFMANIGKKASSRLILDRHASLVDLTIIVITQALQVYASRLAAILYQKSHQHQEADDQQRFGQAAHQPNRNTKRHQHARQENEVGTVPDRECAGACRYATR